MSDQCGCGCSNSITALQGEQGADGTSTGVVTGSLSTTAAVHYVYTANRLNSSSNDIYNTGSGYQWNILTVPAVGSANVAIFNVSAQINATDVHNVTATVLLNGAPVANVQAKQNCGTFESFTWGFQLGTLSENDVVILKLLSDGAAVTPVLRGGLVTVNIYS